MSNKKNNNNNKINTNNFILGVSPKPSEELISRLKNLENVSTSIKSPNKIETVITETIDKLEHNAHTLNNKISTFNNEKKALSELHQKELVRLKGIIRTLKGSNDNAFLLNTLDFATPGYSEPTHLKWDAFTNRRIIFYLIRNGLIHVTNSDRDIFPSENEELVSPRVDRMPLI